MENESGVKTPYHPRRPPRITTYSSLPLYFVTFNSHKRRRLLDACDVHDTLRSYCEEAGRRGIAVGRYVIMPDHIHLFVRLPVEGIGLSRWMQGLRTAVGKTLLRMGYAKPHWQEGFFDHVLRSDESYGDKWRYVAENPVRAGLVCRAEQWPYQGEMVVIDRA
jgi:REP element-mobilizing transposase RayT